MAMAPPMLATPAMSTVVEIEVKSSRERANTSTSRFESITPPAQATVVFTTLAKSSPAPKPAPSVIEKAPARPSKSVSAKAWTRTPVAGSAAPAPGPNRFTLAPELTSARVVSLRMVKLSEPIPARRPASSPPSERRSASSREVAETISPCASRIVVLPSSSRIGTESVPVAPRANTTAPAPRPAVVTSLLRTALPENPIPATNARDPDPALLSISPSPSASTRTFPPASTDPSIQARVLVSRKTKATEPATAIVAGSGNPNSGNGKSGAIVPLTSDVTRSTDVACTSTSSAAFTRAPLPTRARTSRPTSSTSRAAPTPRREPSP